MRGTRGILWQVYRLCRKAETTYGRFTRRSWSERGFSLAKNGMLIAVIPMGIIVVWMLHLFRGILLVRIGHLRHERIGHLATNTELFLRRRSQDVEMQRNFYLFFSGPPANKHLLRMIRHHMAVVEGDIALSAYTKIRSMTQNAKVWVDLPMETREYYEFDNIAPQLSLLPEDRSFAEDFLQNSVGLESVDRFICFQARDQAYLDMFHSYQTRVEWSYHDYRDTDIDNYMLAAEAICELGLWAFRTGKAVNKPIRPTHSRIINYASTMRSDERDMYLLGSCEFFLTDTSGIWSVPTCLGVPVASVNRVPLAEIPFTSKDLFIYKKFWSIEEKRLLGFGELFEMGADRWLNGHFFRDARIELVENTADEIKALTLEMLARIDGYWEATDEDEELQHRFRSFFRPEHWCYGFPSRLGANYLRENEELLR
jgi:putative glycosyltransferase (TIGR04372 family)